MKGLGVSPGIAMGQVYVDWKEQIEIEKDYIDDPEGEVERFNLAAATAAVEIRRLYARENAVRDEDQAGPDLYRVHGETLEDPEFTGEIREHLLEALADAQRAADAGGRDRRARILEAILCANASSGELARRRAEVKQVMKDAGSFIDDATIAALEQLGFRYISGSNHHKLDYAGIRFPVAKTPSDHRSCLNSAAEICNRVF